ncbi:Narbonolide/10-deoxymethynolide synthase PikA2, modules 3 and 4 [bacterium HR33]|nr:Narbonolide/10-deoxymethynolide synthase PikA2, modules 3 and 4 [bacterium HR33]
MRAVVITEPGGPEVLALRELPVPAPGTGELLVRVRASGVNRADLLQRAGRYPAPEGVPADVPGLEFAGEVAELGPGATAWRAGDRVMGIVAGGGYAEYLAVDATHVLPLPDSWSFQEGAAVPEAFLTAFDALLLQAGLANGERLLIHAVGSSVGVAALQLAKAVGATVAGTSRTRWKLERAQELGLDLALPVEDSFSPDHRIAGWADVILDLVGGGYVSGDLVASAPKGRIMLVGLTAGRTAKLDLSLLLAKRLRLWGTVLRSRSKEEKAALVRSFAEQVMPRFLSGEIRPVVDRVFPADAVAEAHRYLESNGNFGSVVLAWP